MSIRAVYFDLGGVLLRTEERGPRAQLAESLGLTYAAIEGIVHGGGPDGSAARASIGQLTEAQHWQNVVRELGLPEREIQRVETAYFAGDRLDERLVDFIRALRPQHRTGLISNAWSGLRAWIVNRGFDDAFDSMTISAEVGWGKPDARIYEYALEKLGVQPAQAIFVDDVSANVEAASALGMHGIVFREAGQVMAEINRLLES
jgi:putative hydrolase of the HAD superfamily